MVTVEVDPARVESRLAAGQIECPGCGGVLGGWGYGRVRRVAGLADPVRPRRARCRACAATHVLLPVTLLLRRAYAAERVWAVIKARAGGWGHRRIGVEFAVPAATVRGMAAPGSDAAGVGAGVVCAAGGDRGGGCGDPRCLGVSVAGRVGRGRAGHLGDRGSVRYGRNPRRGDAAAGGGGGQRWAVSGAGLATDRWCNTTRPCRWPRYSVILAKALPGNRFRAGRRAKDMRQNNLGFRFRTGYGCDNGRHGGSRGVGGVEVRGAAPAPG